MIFYDGLYCNFIIATANLYCTAQQVHALNMFIAYLRIVTVGPQAIVTVVIHYVIIQLIVNFTIE